MTNSRSDLIVSVSGIRGIVGEGLTPEAALAFAAALGTYVEGRKVVLARDGRPSGLMLRHAVLAGLISTGCEVCDLGVMPTPTVGVAVRHLQAGGGIQITASHNPAPWNGLKLFGAEGAILNANRGREVQSLFERRAFRRCAWQDLGHFHDEHRAGDWHLESVLRLIDVPTIRARQLTALLDGNGGAGGPLGKELLNALQCRPVTIHCHADGDFVHEPEPTAENLREVCPRVAEEGADIGFALDPDSDRLALIDERGRYIGEELTLALAVQHRLRHEPGPVVINMSTSRVVEDICQRAGVPCHRSAVGEANVVEMMREVGAVIGGEGNGGVIDPRVGWVRDPFIGMGLMLNLLADDQKPLSEIVTSLPSYSIVKTKYTVDRRGLPRLFEALQRRWPEARVNSVDGLRLDWADRWLHVRPSNTEPLVRVIAEAPAESDALALCRETSALV